MFSSHYAKHIVRFVGLGNRGIACGLVVASTLVGACSGNSPTGPSSVTQPPPPEVKTTVMPFVTSVTVSGSGALTAAGQAAQLTATASLSDGSSQDVTSKAVWMVVNPGVASVSTAGVVTGVGFGTTKVKATYQGVAGEMSVTLQLNVSGTWKGSTADSTGMLQVTFVLSQNGSSVVGTGTFTGGAKGNGTFTGTLSTTSNVLSFNIAGSGAGCTFSSSGSGAVTGNSFSGTYTGANSCVGPLANGVIALTKQ